MTRGDGTASDDSPGPRGVVDSVDGPMFVVLDGIDGCGKTTQAARLVAWLKDRDRKGRTGGGGDGPLHLREPGSTVLGERLREMLLDPGAPIGRGSLALLFTAARRQTLEELVAPAMAQGRDVVIERFHASTFAYQGGPALVHEVGAFAEPELLELLRGWAGAPAPTHEIVLDIDPEDSFARALAREGGGADRFESQGLEFQQRVARAMRRYVDLVPTAVLVNARGTEDQVALAVRESVMRELAGGSHGR